MVPLGLLAVQARRIRRQRRLRRRAPAPVAPLAPVAPPAPVVRLLSVEKVVWDSRRLGITYHCGCSNTVSVWLYFTGYKSVRVTPFSPQVQVNIPVVTLEAWDPEGGFRVRCSCECGCGCRVCLVRDRLRGVIDVILL